MYEIKKTLKHACDMKENWDLNMREVKRNIDSEKIPLPYAEI